LPCSSIWYRRWDAGVVSSETPFQSFTTACQKTGAFLRHALEQGLDDGHFMVIAGCVDPVVAVFEFVTLWMSRVASPLVVHDELRAFVARMRERNER